MWSKYEPKGNDSGYRSCAVRPATKAQSATGYNEVAFIANMSQPLSSNDMAFRVDHAFSSKWNWFASYRYFKLTQASARSKYDIGGFFPATSWACRGSGEPAAAALVYRDRPDHQHHKQPDQRLPLQLPAQFWQWGDNNAPPQISGLGGALEPIGENATYALTPFNVNTQNIRTRFWDGQDNFFSDNLSLLKGNHLLQFGGQFQHNYNYHQRSDNGGGINFTPTYQLGDGRDRATWSMTDLGGGYPSNKHSSPRGCGGSGHRHRLAGGLHPQRRRA